MLAAQVVCLTRCGEPHNFSWLGVGLLRRLPSRTPDDVFMRAEVAMDNRVNTRAYARAITICHIVTVTPVLAALIYGGIKGAEPKTRIGFCTLTALNSSHPVCTRCM